MTGDRGGPPPREEDTDAMDLDAVLREVVSRVDPVPPAVERYAHAAYAFRTADEDFADLEWDSWTDDAEALTRGPDGTRMLVFGPAGEAGTSIHLGLTRTATGLDLDGLVEPPGPGEAEVEFRGGVIRRPVDSGGRFDADLPAVRSIRLRLRGPDSAPTVTGWVALG
jgi:hypothetical protein